MPDAEDLESVAGRLRACLSECRYGEARDSLLRYCVSMRTIAAGIPSGDPRLRRLEDDWRRLLGETQNRAVAGRAHVAVRLAQMSRPTPNYSQPCPPRHTWACTG